MRIPLLLIIHSVTEKAIADPETAVALLANQYESVFSEPDILPTPPDIQPTPCIETIDITTERFKRALRSSKNNTSAGPDNIPSMLLKQGADTLAEPLAILWEKSFEDANIPSIHLKGTITPVKKKGKKIPKNFRPIVLLTNFSKVFERVIVEQLTEYLERNNLLNPDQYGFRKHYSTTAKILRSIDHISTKLAKNQPFDSIQLDLSKAFDKLSIAKLIEAAINIGICGKLLSWLKAYLTGRTLSVKVGDTYSREILMKSGVPQGSVLGPLLFLVAVNGLPKDCPERELLLAFADDTEMGDEADQPERLQRTLSRYNESCKKVGLQLNAEKCEILHYGANNPHN